jgi:hypothetical protein
MEKFYELEIKLGTCYRKVHHYDFCRLPEDEQDAICQKERQEFRNYINSDAMNHISLLKDKLRAMEGN